MNERSVVVTGLGAVTPFGIGVPALRHGLRQGASAASLISSFDVSQLPTRFAASAPDDCQLDPLVKNQKSLKTMCRAAKLGVVAAQEAVKDANLDAVAVDPYRFGVSTAISV